MPSSAPIELGTRFEVRGLLGRGGMGSVYEAYDRGREEVVALKTLERLEPLAVVRLKQEFRVLRGVAHPNLVTFHELHEHDGRPFISMERIAGQSFVEWVRDEAGYDGFTASDTATVPDLGGAHMGIAPVRVGDVEEAPEAPAFDDARLRSGLRQLARALLAVHRADRVHRDVKPSNVRVTREGRVVLLDFGVATLKGRGEDLAGTIAYMAPEQAGEGNVQPAADWYALGGLLFCALTGRLPFDGADVKVLYEKAVRRPPPPSRYTFPLPDDLEDLCVRMLVPDPAERAGAREVFAVCSERRVERSEPPPRPPPSLIGRHSTLGALRDLWDEARHGGPVATWVAGPAGSGRTRTLDELASALADDGALVLRGRVDDRETIAYRGADQIVEALADSEPAQKKGLGPEGVWLASLFPSVWRSLIIPDAVPETLADPSEQRRRAFAVFADWVATIARTHPVAVLVDDAEHLDQGGAALLAALLDPPEPTRVLVVLSRARSAAPPEALAAVPTLSLPELTHAELSELADRALDGAAEPAVLDALVTLCEGRPERLLELTDDLRNAATANAVDLEETVQQRFARLGELERELLELAALCFAPMDVATAAHASGAPRERVAACVEALRVAHLVRAAPDRGRTAFRIPALVERVVAAEVAPDRRGAIHARLARALQEERPHQLHAIARHHVEAGEPERAAAPLVMAITDAQASLAFERLAELCALAARAEPNRRAQWTARRGEALAWAGRTEAAGEACLEAAGLRADRGDALTDRMDAARHLLRGGYVARGLDVLRDILAAVDVALPRNAYAALPALLGRRAQLLLRGYGYELRPVSEISPEDRLRIDACWTAASLLNVDIYLGAYFQTLYILHSLRAGDAAHVARALALESPLLAAAGQRGRAERLSAQAFELAERVGDTQAIGLAYGTRGLSLLQSGRWRDARPKLETAERVLRERCPGAFWELVTCQAAHGWSLAYLGELRALRRALHASRAAAQARGDVYGGTNLTVAVPIFAPLLVGDAEGARQSLREGMTLWSREAGDGFHVQHFFHVVNDATIDLFTSDGRRALARLEAAEGKVRRSQLLRNQLLRIVWHDLYGRVCVAALRTDDAKRHARRVDRERAAWASPLAALLRASVAHLELDSDRAVRELERARSGFGEVGMSLHEAVALHALDAYGRGEPLTQGAWSARERPADPDGLVALLAPSF